MYITKEEQERDDAIIGRNTPRYYIGNYINPRRLGEDIKVFSKFGDYGDITNVTGYGLFSSKYGVFVEPSINVSFTQGAISENRYITDAGTLSVGFSGEMKLKPGYEEGYVYGPGAYYYPDAKSIGNISYKEAEEVLKYAIEKSNGGELKPVSPEELYSVISNIRGLEEEKHTAMGR